MGFYRLFAPLKSSIFGGMLFDFLPFGLLLPPARLKDEENLLRGFYNDTTICIFNLIIFVFDLNFQATTTATKTTKKNYCTVENGDAQK